MKLLLGRRSPARDRAHVGLELPVAHGPGQQRPEHRLRQQRLDPARPMGFREQAPVQEHHAVYAQAPLALTRQQLLRHAVPVVVRKHMRRFDAEILQQRLADVGLLNDRVGMPGRLLGHAETEQVAGVQRILLREPGPEPVPVVARSRIAVDQQQRRPALVHRAAHEDPVTAQGPGFSRSDPFVQRPRNLQYPHSRPADGITAIRTPTVC